MSLIKSTKFQILLLIFISCSKKNWPQFNSVFKQKKSKTSVWINFYRQGEQHLQGEQHHHVAFRLVFDRRIGLIPVCMILHVDIFYCGCSPNGRSPQTTRTVFFLLVHRNLCWTLSEIRNEHSEAFLCHKHSSVFVKENKPCMISKCHEYPTRGLLCPISLDLWIGKRKLYNFILKIFTKIGPYQ